MSVTRPSSEDSLKRANVRNVGFFNVSTLTSLPYRQIVDDSYLMFFSLLNGCF